MVHSLLCGNGDCGCSLCVFSLQSNHTCSTHAQSHAHWSKNLRDTPCKFPTLGKQQAMAYDSHFCQLCRCQQCLQALRTFWVVIALNLCILSYNKHLLADGQYSPLFTRTSNPFFTQRQQPNPGVSQAVTYLSYPCAGLLLLLSYLSHYSCLVLLSGLLLLSYPLRGLWVLLVDELRASASAWHWLLHSLCRENC